MNYMEKEDLEKKLENIDVPFIEMSSHKARLKTALLDSDCFKEQHHPLWFGKLTIVGLSGAFVLLIFFASKLMLLDDSNNSIPSASVFPVAVKETPAIAPDPTRGWDAYYNKGLGYKIRLPKDLELGAVEQREGLGGINDFYLTQEWSIKPAPVFEYIPEKKPNLIWMIRDKNGNTKLLVGVQSKAKSGNISLEKFADDILTPKDKIISLSSTKIKIGKNDVIRQDLQISDPAYSGTRYLISGNKYFFIIETIGAVDPNLIIEIISTFELTE